MKVWALWHGGYSYGHSGVEDVEVFDSIAAAVNAHDDRYRCQTWSHHFEFINREPENSYCPATDDSSEMRLFFEDPTEGDQLHPDLYPDRIITIGPREGIRVERT